METGCTARDGDIEKMFSAIASKYDLLNSVLSFNQHKKWRVFASRKLELKDLDCALDICCGTGDFTIELAKHTGAGGRVVGVDFSEPMLEIARKKSAASGFGNIAYERASALCLPFEDNSFDAVSIGFGLRNVSDVPLAISEIARVLRPGGRVVCLETARVQIPVLSSLWRLYFYTLSPYIARIFRGNGNAYDYLPRSVRHFASRQELAGMFSEGGLVDIKYYDLSFGTVCVHIASKPVSVI